MPVSPTWQKELEDEYLNQIRWELLVTLIHLLEESSLVR